MKPDKSISIESNAYPKRAYTIVSDLTPVELFEGLAAISNLNRRIDELEQKLNRVDEYYKKYLNRQEPTELQKERTRLAIEAMQRRRLEEEERSGLNTEQRIRLMMERIKAEKVND